MNNSSYPMNMKDIHVTDTFWSGKMELVRKEVLPYQWNALNDRVEGAAPSFCMHNFKAAGKLIKERTKNGASYTSPGYPTSTFETLPGNDGVKDDHFYGFVFQDTDFSKWIEAVAFSLMNHPDSKLEETADEAIQIVCDAQLPNGYLDTFYIINDMNQSFTNLKDYHELYCFGHLTEGAVAYYRATGKDPLLKTAMRFADYLYDHFGPEPYKLQGYPGHEIAEMALCKLFEVTHEERYLSLSRFFIEERGKKPYYFDQENDTLKIVREEDKKKIRYGYYQAHLPVREQDKAVGHAVRAVYLYSGMADVARLTQDKSLLDACERLFDNISQKQMYITGGIGSTHMGEAFTYDYDLPNDTVYAETCASIGLVFFARRMLQMRIDSKYSNVMERALYNGILSGMANDGKSFFYVNPLEVNPADCKNDPGKFHVKSIRQKWFGCACCPPNIARLLSSISEYAYTEDEDTLYIHLYMGSTLTKVINGQEVQVQIDSHIPNNGRMSIRVTSPTTNAFNLAIRIPEWCGTYTLQGKQCTNSKNGYLYFDNFAQGETTIEIDWDMKVKTIYANPKVREDVDKVAYTYGPYVYCAEEVDNGKDLYLLRLDTTQVPAIKNETFLGSNQPILYVPGERITYQETEQLYTNTLTTTTTPVTVKLIPYYLWNNRGEGEMSVWMKIHMI